MTAGNADEQNMLFETRQSEGRCAADHMQVQTQILEFYWSTVVRETVRTETENSRDLASRPAACSPGV